VLTQPPCVEILRIEDLQASAQQLMSEPGR
jgi:hypothetical protein